MSRFPSNIRFEYRECHPTNFTSGSWRKDFITLHWWDDPSRRPQFDGVVSWFQDARANVSIQYMVESGRITQMIPESAMAWHAGNAQANRHGIGIEVNPRLSAGDYEATAQLVAEIWRRRGSKLPLRRHREFTGTSCPGHMDINRIRNRANQIYAGRGSTAPAVTTPEKDKPLSLTNANIQNIAAAVWRYSGRDFLNENPQFKDTQIARAYQYTAEQPDRVWLRQRDSLVTGNRISMSNTLAQAHRHSNEANRKIDALADVLDKVLDGQGEILKAVKNVGDANEDKPDNDKGSDASEDDA